jgi:hypothetical protein
MADLIKALFNKKKKVAAVETEKPVAPAKAVKAEEKATETNPAPEVKAKGGLGGLFGSRKNEPDFVPAPEPARYVAPEEDANSYFLDADSAKTFGDIDYMRTSKAVRKTFPKVLGAKEGAEMFESTSSMDKADSMPQVAKSEASEIKPSQESSDRRRRDTSMDMFRNMAKDIKR